MSIEGQGHFLTVVQGRVLAKIHIRFSQKILCRSEPNFARKLSTMLEDKELLEGTRKCKSDDMMLVT